MKVKLYKSMALLVALLYASFLFAQQTVHQVLFLNEGRVDIYTGEILIPVTIGSYDPATKEYVVVDTIEGARFGSDISIAGDFYYIAADSLLLKYDLNTHERLASQTVKGIRKIADWEDQLIVTRGEFLQSFNSYVQVYNESDLSFAYEYTVDDSDIDFAAEGVVIKDDKAFIAVNNGFDFGNEVGQIAILDLVSQENTDLIDLGPDGKNPDNLMIRGEEIFTLNNKDYTGSSVSTMDVSNNAVSTVDLASVSAGCGTSAFFQEAVYFQEFGNTQVGKFNVQTEETDGFIEFNKNFYGLIFDPVNELIYATETDFVSFGEAFIYSADGVLLDSFEVGVTPANITLDILQLSSVSGVEENFDLEVFPNPVKGNLLIRTTLESEGAYQLFGLGGALIQAGNLQGTQTQLSVGNLPEGVYLLRVVSDGVVQTRKVIKQ